MTHTFPEPWNSPTAEPLYWLPPDERDDFSEPIPCPDCSRDWQEGLPACPTCGLTLVEIADRLAR